MISKTHTDYDETIEARRNRIFEAYKSLFQEHELTVVHGNPDVKSLETCRVFKCQRPKEHKHSWNCWYNVIFAPNMISISGDIDGITLTQRHSLQWLLKSYKSMVYVLEKADPYVRDDKLFIPAEVSLYLEDDENFPENGSFGSKEKFQSEWGYMKRWTCSERLADKWLEYFNDETGEFEVFDSWFDWSDRVLRGYCALVRFCELYEKNFL